MKTVSKESKIMGEIYGRVYQYEINRLNMRSNLTGFIRFSESCLIRGFVEPSSSLPAVRQDDSATNRAEFYRK
jgi:hypothetical protein